MKYGKKNAEENIRDSKSYAWYHRFKFQDCYWLKLIIFFI